MTLSGCASREEKRAFAQWMAIDPQVRGGSREHITHLDQTGAPTAAQPTGDFTESSTLADYYAHALRHNPGLAAAAQRWKAALERVPQTRSLPDPRFQYTRDNMDRENTYALMQMLMWPGKLDAETRMALDMAKSAGQQYEAQKAQLIARITRLQAERWYLQRSYDIAQRNRDIMAQIEQATQVRLEAGSAPQSDVIRAQVELERMATEIREVQLMTAPMTADLNAALGRAVNAPLPPAPMPQLPAEAIDEAQLLAHLRQHSPELKAMQSEVDSAQAGLRSARLARVPDVEVGGMYMTDEMEDDAGGVQVGVTLPIWNDKYEARSREARANYRAAHRNLADKTLMMEADLLGAVAGLRDAQRRLDLYEKSLTPKGQQYFDSLLSTYRTGTGMATGPMSPFADLVEAQRLLAQFQLNRDRAAADAATKHAQIQAMLGVISFVARTHAPDPTSPSTQPHTTPPAQNPPATMSMPTPAPTPTSMPMDMNRSSSN